MSLKGSLVIVNATSVIIDSDSRFHRYKVIMVLFSFSTSRGIGRHDSLKFALDTHGRYDTDWLRLCLRADRRRLL